MATNTSASPAEEPLPPGTIEYLPKMAEMRGNPGASEIVLTESDRLDTPSHFQPPVEITIVAKTDSTNLRLAYAATQVIFNWEQHLNELRIDGGPASGQHQPDAGRLPFDTYVRIKWLVTPERQTIYVNDELRFTHAGDYSQIDRPVTIFPAWHSIVTVKSFRVKSLSER